MIFFFLCGRARRYGFAILPPPHARPSSPDNAPPAIRPQGGGRASGAERSEQRAQRAGGGWERRFFFTIYTLSNNGSTIIVYLCHKKNIMRNYNDKEFRKNLEVLQENFVEFLRENDVLNQFENYCGCSLTNSKEYFESLGDDYYEPRSWVLSAFLFWHTSEGFAFWSKINTMWLHQLATDNEL